MAATKTLTAVDNLLLRLIPNWTQQVQDGDTTKTQFTQWALKMTGVATDNAGTKETGCEVTMFGSWQDTPYTPPKTTIRFSCCCQHHEHRGCKCYEDVLPKHD